MKNAYEFKFNAWVNGSGKPRMIKWKDIDAIEWCNDKLWYNNGNYSLLGNIILLRWTGFKIGRKELYEGDVIEYKLKSENGNVSIITCEVSFQKYGWHPFIDPLYSLDKAFDLRILGSIHEYPDLLPQK